MLPRFANGSTCRERTDVAVQRFRSAAEMQAAPIQTATGSDFGRFLRHCARFRAIAPIAYPRGVVKFHNVQEAQAARAQVVSGQAPHLGEGVR